MDKFTLGLLTGYPDDRKILWGSKIQQSPPAVTYEEAMAEDDRGLFKWLTNVVSVLNSFIHPFLLFIYCICVFLG